MYIQEAPVSQEASFEAHRSPKQDLTFDAVRALFGRKGVVFDPALLLELGIQDATGAYTNLGLLLSDQNPFEIRIAVYGEAGHADASERRAFTGSLPQQLQDALACLAQLNPGEAAYPAVCLRAALVNAVAHRDYACGGPILVNVYADRVRVVSPGGLAGAMTVDDALQGVSVSRNPGLADALGQLGLFDGYGAGLQAIIAHYRPTGHAPQFEAAPCSVVTELPDLTCPPPAPEPELQAQAQPQGVVIKPGTPGPKPSFPTPPPFPVSTPATAKPAASSGKVTGAAPMGEKLWYDRYDNNDLTQELLKHIARKPKQNKQDEQPNK